MTRPVADILAEAERDDWPTSSIDAMAKHHLCGNFAREHVNDYSTEEPVADPNCSHCHGTGWRDPTLTELGRSGGDQVRCGC